MMLYRKIQSVLRRFLPRPVAEGIRAVATAILTPIHFSARTGHFRSSLARKALDRAGSPIPWYTYPAIDFLKAQNLAGRAVLEFGAGQSTLWWSARSAQVTSIESDPDWFEYVKGLAPPNAALHLVPNNLAGIEQILQEDKYDVIVIDGLDRLMAALFARNRLAVDGCVILDNSEGYWGPDGTYPILDFYRTHGFSRVDFYGNAPGVFLPHCTSLFFQGSCFLFSGADNTLRD